MLAGAHGAPSPRARAPAPHRARPPPAARRPPPAARRIDVRSSAPVSGGPANAKKREPMTVRMDANTADLRGMRRGMRVDDAEAELERRLNRAHAVSDVVYVIHGHGTGQLKAAVHDFLRSHPLVARYEVAKEGGGGLTVAYFK
eukprot:tig00020629_g12476.t1